MCSTETPWADRHNSFDLHCCWKIYRICSGSQVRESETYSISSVINIDAYTNAYTNAHLCPAAAVGTSLITQGWCNNGNASLFGSEAQGSAPAGFPSLLVLGLLVPASPQLLQEDTGGLAVPSTEQQEPTLSKGPVQSLQGERCRDTPRRAGGWPRVCGCSHGQHIPILSPSHPAAFVPGRFLEWRLSGQFSWQPMQSLSLSFRSMSR